MLEFDVEGFDKIVKRIEDMTNPRTLEKAMGKACAIVERDAIKKAPKGAGDLRRSIQSRVESDGHEVIGIIFSPLEYAPYVEYGTGLFAESGGRTDVPWVYCDDEGNFHSTSGMKPQPYMRPALNENREKILKTIKEGMLNG